MSQISRYSAAAVAGVNTLTALPAGTVVNPVAGTINLTGAGGIVVTGAGNTITITGGALGTTNHAVQVGTAGGGLNSIPVGGANTVLAGIAGADPAFTATPTVTSITATNFYTGDPAATAEVLAIGGHTITAEGTDANISVVVTPKGTGNLTVNGDIYTQSGTVYGATIETVLASHLALYLNQNGIYSYSDTLANVDVSITTQGSGAFVIDCLPADATLLSQWRTAQAYVQTTDATVTTIVSIPLAQKQMITVQATINGFKSTYDHAAAGTISSSAFRPNGGNITVVGQHQINFASDPTATATVTIVDAVNVGTQSLELHVTGAAGETWNWVVTYSYSYTTNP